MDFLRILPPLWRYTTMLELTIGRHRFCFDFSFFLLIAVVCRLQNEKLFLLSILAIALHEFAHILAIIGEKIPVKSINFTVFGIHIVRSEDWCTQQSKLVWVYLAGGAAVFGFGPRCRRGVLRLCQPAVGYSTFAPGWKSGRRQCAESCIGLFVSRTTGKANFSMALLRYLVSAHSDYEENSWWTESNSLAFMALHVCCYGSVRIEILHIKNATEYPSRFSLFYGD